MEFLHLKTLQISGEFEGEIVSDGFLVNISEGAVIRANIKAHTVVVAGHVTGNVIATERLEMQSTVKSLEI